MTAAEMRIHVYDVHRENSPPLEQAITTMANFPLVNRLRTIGDHELRLEKFEPPFSENNDTAYWLLDFIRIRFDNGPGKASRTEEIQGFDLDDDDGFGEETAALYDAQKRVLIIQYNHNGPRSSRIGSYFNTFDPQILHDYQFWAKLDDSTSAKLGSKSIIKKFTVKIAPSKLSAQQRNSGVGMSKAMAVSDYLNGQHIEITVSSSNSPNSKLNLANAIAFATSLLGYKDIEGVIEKLEIVGKSSPTAKSEAIDLLLEKLEVCVGNLEMGPDRRYTTRSRWNGLIRARNGWANRF